MIFLNGQSYGEHRHVLSRHLEGEIVPFFERDPARAKEIAEAVAALCDQYYSDKALTADQLTLFVSRAMLAVGEDDIAEQWLDRWTGDTTQTQKLLLAVKNTASLPAFVAGLSGRVFRHGEWRSSNDGPAWVLDLNRIKLNSSDVLEVVYLQAVRTMLEGLMGVWDASSGRGALMVRGLELSKKIDTGFADELKQFVEGFLSREQRKRGWSSEPRLVFLEATQNSGNVLI